MKGWRLINKFIGMYKGIVRIESWVFKKSNARRMARHEWITYMRKSIIIERVERDQPEMRLEVKKNKKKKDIWNHHGNSLTLHVVGLGLVKENKL